ncbi:MAG: hypothetical protein AAGA15_01545 [Pseudomonadota bacterium]
MKIAADGISARFDASLGILTGFDVGGVSPLHTAPWVGSSVGQEEMPEDAAPHLAKLGGDFFCAPFGSTEGNSPLHGWPPNSPWDAEMHGNVLRAKLRRKVQGADLSKEITLLDGHPFVYQRHIFDGGKGALAVANHANVSLLLGGAIYTSPKSWWETPETAPEPDPTRGRSSLKYPARGSATQFPSENGTADLTRFPWGGAHEDFVCGLEESGHALGWTAVARTGRDDVFLSLRDARQLPMTMLWHSNGGRDYAPWSGRHRNCLGVEEGAALAMLSDSDQRDFPARGALELGGRVDICHVIGALPWPDGEPVTNIELRGDRLLISGQSGSQVSVPIAADRIFSDGGP